MRGYMLAANARHLSTNILAEYKNTFPVFADHVGNGTLFAEIGSMHIAKFMILFSISNIPAVLTQLPPLHLRAEPVKTHWVKVG